MKNDMKISESSVWWIRKMVSAVCLSLCKPMFVFAISVSSFSAQVLAAETRMTISLNGTWQIEESVGTNEMPAVFGHTVVVPVTNAVPDVEHKGKSKPGVKAGDQGATPSLDNQGLPQNQ